ncbi:MAG: class I poly(R)-hydroxyalkanoic acid synthase [Betaproteobacteria bacterium]|nr:class I poly(R)-hydroxyalkanoic acid synthase [Betaproteobacteria bacterium]
MLAALSGTVLPGGASWAADPAAWSARLSADSKRLAPQFAPEFGTPQFLAIQTAYAERQGALWKSLLARETGAAAPAEGAATVPDRSDKRFKAAEWHQNPYYDYLRQSYLLASDYCNELVEAVEAEPKAKERLRFTVRQWIDASCPANFPATNPEALQKAIETGGESLSKGLANMLADAGKGQISQTDETAFEVGRNLAISPGAVVYENELIQLIQYAPATKTVARRPLVIVPPCINKFYILDLQPENSFVGYAVGEGHTVFMVSWRNVKADLGHFTWDDYVDKGVIEALRVAREIAASDKVNALGFCVGGTLLAAALAVLKARAEPVVESVTYLTSLLDFSDTGQIGCLVDEQATQAREQSIGAGGILPGSELTSVFSALRANDLIWPYVVSNYLKGESPVAFDLLFWNADTTNLPGPMYCWYLRNMYLENRLREPGALRVCGVPVDLGGIGLPSFIYGSREDHIVPWKSTYQSIGLLGGEVTYVLGASGHIAGVVNPPAKRKRSHWVSRGGAATSHPTEPQEWFAQAIEHPGSWWPVWSNWLLAHRGGERKVAKTRKWGNKRHKAIEPAPGRYVKEKFNS